VDPVGGYATASGSTLTINGYRIRIDGRGLSHDLLPLLLGWTTGFLSRRTINELTLVPAVHYGFQPGSGIVGDFTFAIRSDGSIVVPPSCTGFLRVTGTDTLVVGGYAIVVDASRADSNLLSVVNVGIPAATATHLFAVLVPCDGYQLQTASGVFSYGFGVERDGSITVDPRVPASSHAVNTIPRLEVIGTTPW